MLKIRLQRTGKRGQAYFRVVVLEHTTKPKGKYLELLGSYDPHKNEISVKADRVKYWLSMGAQLSETANNLLVGKGVIEGEKVKVWKPKKKKPSSQGHSTELSQGPQAEGKEKDAVQAKAAPTTTPAEKPQTEEPPALKEKMEESEPAKAAEEAAPTPTEPTEETASPIDHPAG